MIKIAPPSAEVRLIVGAQRELPDLPPPKILSPNLKPGKYKIKIQEGDKLSVFPGTYKFKISAPNYYPKLITVKVNPWESSKIEIRLKPKPKPKPKPAPETRPKPKAKPKTKPAPKTRPTTLKVIKIAKEPTKRKTKSPWLWLGPVLGGVALGTAIVTTAIILSQPKEIYSIEVYGFWGVKLPNRK